MDSEAARYSVEVWDWDDYWAAFEALPEAQQVRVSELMANHLPFRPNQMRPPLLKQLHGTHSHLKQFECGSHRLIYEVLEDEAKVRVVFLGLHPPWEKRAKVGG